jgi:hypothetical protein
VAPITTGATDNYKYTLNNQFVQFYYYFYLSKKLKINQNAHHSTMRQPALKIVFPGILLLITFIGQAQKTDKVFMKNGDVITGEIKSLKFAKLRFDMTGPGNIDIKWEEVVQIRSEKLFQITLRKGDVLLEKLDSLFFEKYHTRLEDLVEIVQIKDRFIKRLEGNVSLGFNYTKSSDIVQFNFGGSITYRKPKIENTFKLNSVITDNSSDSFLAKKQDATLQQYRKLNHNMYVQGALGWQQNTQLGLQNRVALAGVGGKIILNDNQRRLLTGGGLSYNLEQSSENIEFLQNLEAVLVIQYKKFRYSTPKVSIDAEYLLYPNLTDWGRVRMTFDLSAKYEIFKDFNVGLTFYDNYDNRPPSGAVTKNDLGIDLTVSFEFGK